MSEIQKWLVFKTTENEGEYVVNSACAPSFEAMLKALGYTVTVEELESAESQGHSEQPF
jgi:hypothetical protein